MLIVVLFIMIANNVNTLFLRDVCVEVTHI